MFIPIRTDYRMSRTPWVNYGLIAANVLLFLLGYHAMTEQSVGRIEAWMLWPDRPELHQFFSSVFLHGGWMHLIGNMIFLWVFGNALNDRFGQAGYLAFYLAGGILAGIGYVLLAGRAPVLGASGAIAAVTGAYLVLFPRVRVTLLVLFIFITFWEVSSIYFLLFQFIYNLFLTLGEYGGAFSGGGVAYAAHSSGYLFGIGVAAALLATRVLPREPYDLLNLIRDRRRRGQYRRMVSGGADPFNYTRPPKAPPRRKRVPSRQQEPPQAADARAKEIRLRQDISAAHSRGDFAEAADRYLQLVQVADDALLPRQQQLDVANQLMSSERYAPAADAYERFVRRYADYEHLPDIHLMLGLLYGRYLHQYDRAEDRLARATEGLREESKKELARQELESVRSRRG